MGPLTLNTQVLWWCSVVLAVPSVYLLFSYNKQQMSWYCLSLMPCTFIVFVCKVCKNNITLNYFSYADYIILPIAHIWSLKSKSVWTYFHKQKNVQPGSFSHKRWILDMFACVSFLIIWWQRQIPWSSAKDSIFSWKMKNSIKKNLKYSQYKI